MGNWFASFFERPGKRQRALPGANSRSPYSTGAQEIRRKAEDEKRAEDENMSDLSTNYSYDQNAGQNQNKNDSYLPPDTPPSEYSNFNSDTLKTDPLSQIAFNSDVKPQDGGKLLTEEDHIIHASSTEHTISYENNISTGHQNVQLLAEEPITDAQNQDFKPDENSLIQPQFAGDNTTLTPEKKESVNKIADINTNISQLVKDIDDFSGSKYDRQYIYLDEMLTRNLLKLDNVEIHNDQDIHAFRREAIRYSHKSLTKLKDKVRESENDLANEEGSEEEGTAV